MCEDLLVPQWKLTAFDRVEKHDGTELRMIVQATGPTSVVLCSHDCDIENAAGRAGIVLAPVGPPSFGWSSDDERWHVLRDSWKMTSEHAFEFGHLFPLDLNLGGSHEWAVVDFSRMMTVGPSGKVTAILLRHKKSEMTDEVRAAFGLKLAAFFGRGAVDVTATDAASPITEGSAG